MCDRAINPDAIDNGVNAFAFNYIIDCDSKPLNLHFPGTLVHHRLPKVHYILICGV